MATDASLPLLSPPEAPSERPRRVNRSCTLCTQRKVKCDGGYPCKSCERHKSPHLCAYRQRTKRQVVSRSNHQQLLDQLQTYADIVERAFPGMSLDQLSGKNSTELGQLSHSQQPPSQASQPSQHSQQQQQQQQFFFEPAQSVASHSNSTHSYMGQHTSPLDGVVAEGVEEEEGDDADSDDDDAAPERRWEESNAQQPYNALETNDNNAINTVTDEQNRPSFLGVTSSNAIFRAIFRLNPLAKQHVTDRTKALNATPAPSLIGSSISTGYLPDDTFSLLKQQRFIDFYFETLHPITPILNEDNFREAFQSGRQDPSWLGLLYVVLALGSIASGSNSLHGVYYQRAQACLNFDTLGTGNIEGLQALCLLGGFYLNFRSSPNMGFAIRGAAHRMAVALGLHRESRRNSLETERGDTPRNVSRAESHRRVWWSLFCLDTWMNMTLGRPTCGRWDPNTMDVRLPSSIHPEDYAGMSLRASCEFNVICTRIQDRFARIQSPLSVKEALAFDAELHGWYNSLPPVLFPAPECPPRLLIARQFLRQRYSNARLLLLRTILFRLASCRHQRQLTSEEVTALNLCRSVSVEAIDSVARYWSPNVLSVWNSAWSLFQMCMAPLLCITINKTLWHVETPENLAVWTGCLTQALQTFSELRPWMRGTDPTPDIIEALYEAVMVERDAPATTVTPTLLEGDLTYIGWGEQFGFGAEFDWGLIQPEMDMHHSMNMPTS